MTDEDEVRSANLEQEQVVEASSETEPVPPTGAIVMSKMVPCQPCLCVGHLSNGDIFVRPKGEPVRVTKRESFSDSIYEGWQAVGSFGGPPG